MKITWRGSPNYSKERKPIDRVVCHWFGIGNLKSADSRFQNVSSKVSAHYGVSDDTIYQWCDEDHTAWHAGDWETNLCSVGIEHDAEIGRDATEKTYQTSAQLLKEICERHNIPLDREHIIGHNEVKNTQCPGTLNIDKLIELAKGGEVEVNRRETIQAIYNSIYHRNPTKQELDRWDESQKATSETVAELWSSLEIDKKLEALTVQVSKLEQTVGGMQESVNNRLGNLADSIGQLTTQAEAERKVLSETSLKTDKIQETATDLIKEDIEAEKRFGGLRERMNALETRWKEWKGVHTSENSAETNTEDIRFAVIVEFIDWIKRRFKLGTK